MGLPGQISLDSLLALPGVVDEAVTALRRSGGGLAAGGSRVERRWRTWPACGRRGPRHGRRSFRPIAAPLPLGRPVIRPAPLVADGYRRRLEERLKRVLAEFQVALDPGELVKEVSLFAERGGISEELIRLRSHLDQFDAFLALPESTGRKLEFITQGDVPRSQHHRVQGQRRRNHQRRDRRSSGHRIIREMIQNIE